MQRRSIRRFWFVSIAVLVCVVIAGTLQVIHFELLQHEPRFHDDFHRQSFDTAENREWKAFGGNWKVLDGTMQNISDDRGAKLINGRDSWRDYSVEADIQLLSETGDAGFVIRTNDEEIGVDAYHGYFAGLRDLDDTLILGRADFGWHGFAQVPIRSQVRTRTWYHLKVIAYGCVIAARATTDDGERPVIAVHDSNCIRHGRFGLQSYSTGAVWRNLDVRPATENDLLAMLAGQKPVEPAPPKMDAAGIPLHPVITDLNRYQSEFGPMQRELLNNHANLDAAPIADLRLLAPNVSPRVIVHGVVTMVSPMLFIQDSSGAIAVPNARLVIPVQIGDAVEASGNAEMHKFSSILRDATVRLLWSHTQVPPVAVTASQAATGSFDAQFVQTEGRLTSNRLTNAQSIVFQLDAGDQSFLAVAENLNSSFSIHPFKVGSLLRVRGICVTDKRFTGDQVPFAILLRSGGDVQMLEPPPWWNGQHIVELAFLLVALSIGFQVFYSSIKRSQMRAVMSERERLAMEMHDTLSQSFAGLSFQLEALCNKAEPNSSMRSQLISTLDLVRFGHLQARRNITALRPANLEQLGLPKALEQTARAIVKGGKTEVTMSVRGEPRALPLRVSDALFRIGQEAIANAVRHGRPDQIQIRLHYGKTSVQLTVRDDGSGFAATGENTGYGIRGMRKRAERIAANFRIHSFPGHGTMVSVRARSPRKFYHFRWPEFHLSHSEASGHENAI